MPIEISDEELNAILNTPLFQILLNMRWDESEQTIHYTFNGQIRQFKSFEELRHFINAEILRSPNERD